MSEVQDGTSTPVVPASEVVKDQPAKDVPAAEDQKAEGETETPVETTEQQEAKKQSKFQRRLDRQKAARVAAETEARILREQLAKHEAQKPQQQGNEPPKREQFEDYESYVEARAEWKAEQRANQVLKADREARESKEQQGKQKEVSEKVAKSWTERETAFQAATKGYASAVEDYVSEDLSSLSQQARHAIVESEVGPALLYHLATHPDVSERIADLSPTRQIVELGKLEDKVSMPAKKTTNAPAPANHVNTGKTGSKDPAKMSQPEYRAWMKSQGSRFVS